MIEDCPEHMNHITKGYRFEAEFRHCHLPDGTVLGRWTRRRIAPFIENGNVLLYLPRVGQERLAGKHLIPGWRYIVLSSRPDDIEAAYETWKVVLASDD